MTEISLSSFFAALAFDLLSIILIVYVLYFRRYRNREMAIAIASINITLFALAGALASFTLSLGVGFALFAIISVIRLRSDTAGWIEMSYLLIGLAAGLILGLPAYSLMTQVVYAFTLVIALFIIDNTKLLPDYGRETMNVSLDYVETNLETLRQQVSEKLAMEVSEVSIRSVVLQPPSMKIDVKFQAK